MIPEWLLKRYCEALAPIVQLNVNTRLRINMF